MTPRLIAGPPGTGKTTALLDFVAKQIYLGVQPEEIAFLAFTKKAAAEARGRAIEKFKLPEERFPYFRTIHSIAYKFSGVQRGQLMGWDWAKVASSIGEQITVSRKSAEDGEFNFQATRGDRMKFLYDMARVTETPLRDVWLKAEQQDIGWPELEVFHNTAEAFKKANGKIDFTDMLLKFVKEGDCPKIKVLIVDEAQDLTKAQWRCVDKMKENVEHFVIAGDDDQAIFRWNGADVDAFIDFQGKKEVLPVSYRIPRRVHTLANEVISRVRKRLPKEWSSRAEEGEVQFISSMEELDMSEGTWLLLGRNKCFLSEFEIFCRQRGYLFGSEIVDTPMKNGTVAAIKGWEDLRAGKFIPVWLAVDVVTLMQWGAGANRDKDTKTLLQDEDQRRTIDLKELRREFGVKTSSIWHEALDRIPRGERQYLLEARQKGEKLLAEPRITISTVHGAKGGEASNVVLVMDMTKQTYEAYQEDPEDEHRVFYVGITRAKERLFIMQERGRYCYKL